MMICVSLSGDKAVANTTDGSENSWILDFFVLSIKIILIAYKY